MGKRYEPIREGLHPYTWRWDALREAEKYFFSSPLAWLSVIFTRRSDGTTGVRENVKHVHPKTIIRATYYRASVRDDWQKVTFDDLKAIQLFDADKKKSILNAMRKKHKTPFTRLLAKEGQTVAAFARSSKICISTLRKMAEHNNPTRATMRKIADTLGLTTWDLERIWSDEEALDK